MSALDSTTQTQEARIRDLEERLGSALAEVESVRQGLPLDGEQIAKEARRRFLHFIVDRVNPGYQERHRGDLSSWNQELWKEAGQLGLIGFNAPAEIGGEGRDTGSWNITLEELGKLTEDPGFLIIIVVNKIWANLIHSQGNARLVERFARPMISGDLSLAWAVWEPADLSFMQSVARKVDSGWILSADKPMLTGGQYAGVFAVAVRDEATSEPILFLVERTDPGVKCTPLPTVGGHHIGYASLKLKDTFVPEDRLLLATDAISAVSPRFDFGALDALAVHLGWMQRTVSLCVSSLRSKVRAGMTVLSIPHVQAELGRLFMGVELARAMFLRTLERGRQHDSATESLVVILKHFLTESALDTGRTVMGLQGASGYMDENPWGRYWTHAICLLHAAGAQDLLPQQLGERMLVELEMKKLRKVGF